MSALEPLTEEELVKLELLEAQATERPWSVDMPTSHDSRLYAGEAYGKPHKRRYDRLIALGDTESFCSSAGQVDGIRRNLRFIASARNRLPNLLATVRQQQAEIERLQAAIAELEAELEAKSQEAYAANQQATDSWNLLDDKSRGLLIRKRMRFA